MLWNIQKLWVVLMVLLCIFLLSCEEAPVDYPDCNVALQSCLSELDEDECSEHTFYCSAGPYSTHEVMCECVDDLDYEREIN